MYSATHQQVIMQGGKIASYCDPHPVRGRFRTEAAALNAADKAARKAIRIPVPYYVMELDSARYQIEHGQLLIVGAEDAPQYCCTLLLKAKEEDNG